MKSKRFRHYHQGAPANPTGIAKSPVFDLDRKAVETLAAVQPEPVRNVDGVIVTALPAPIAGHGLAITPAEISAALAEIQEEKPFNGTDIEPTHESGLHYVTESGFRVVIYSTAAGGATPMHGAYMDEHDVFQLYQWKAAGVPYVENCSTDRFKFNMSMRIVGVWYGKLAWPEGMPGWAKHIAKDEDGKWHWYESTALTPGAGRWTAPDGDFGPIPAEFTPKWHGPWRKSLIPRPTV